MGMNKVQLVGAVVRHELRTTAKLTPVLELTLAGVEEVAGKPRSWYVPITYLGKRAERIAQAIAPGAGAVVLGRLEYRSWEKDGETRSRVSLIADQLELFPLNGGGVQPDQAGNPRLAAGAVNRVIVSGNLVRDPEQGEKGPTRTALAVGEWVKTGKEWGEKTHFFDLVSWEDSLTGFGKGDFIFVEGRVSPESWETKEGEKRYATRIEVYRTISLVRPVSAPEVPADGPPI